MCGFIDLRQVEYGVSCVPSQVEIAEVVQHAQLCHHCGEGWRDESPQAFRWRSGRATGVNHTSDIANAQNHGTDIVQDHLLGSGKHCVMTAAEILGRQVLHYLPGLEKTVNLMGHDFTYCWTSSPTGA